MRATSRSRCRKKRKQPQIDATGIRVSSDLGEQGSCDSPVATSLDVNSVIYPILHPVFPVRSQYSETVVELAKVSFPGYAEAKIQVRVRTAAHDDTRISSFAGGHRCKDAVAEFDRHFAQADIFVGVPAGAAPILRDLQFGIDPLKYNVSAGQSRRGVGNGPGAEDLLRLKL